MKSINTKEMQEIELEMMKNLDKVCRKHNIRYSLAYGTLLGAVRHEGFIPWDDDIDIMMPRCDYQKLLTLDKSEFEDGYELWDHTITEGYNHQLAKLVNTKTALIEKVNMDSAKLLGVYIDIFPLDKIPEENYAWNQFYKKCKINSQKLTFSLLKYKKTGNKIKDIVKMIVYTYFHLRGPKVYLRKFDKIIEQSKSLESRMIKDIAIPEMKHNQICLEEFDDLIELSFEDARFFAIRDFDRILKAKYGNYMELPEEKDRVTRHDVVVYWKP